MYVESAFAFTPAAIIIEAKVCRHSCRPIGSSAGSPDSLLFRFCAFQAIRGGRRTALGVNGRAVVAPIADHLKRGVVGSETPARVRWAQTSERCSGGGAARRCRSHAGGVQRGRRCVLVAAPIPMMSLVGGGLGSGASRPAQRIPRCGAGPFVQQCLYEARESDTFVCCALSRPPHQPFLPQI
jgi:hypothetical protein